MLKDDKEKVMSANDDEWMPTPESHFIMQDLANKNIGRYPVKYRFYENYESYRIVNP